MWHKESSNKVILLGDLYCCMLPQCEASHTFPSGFLIKTRGWFQNTQGSTNN